MASLFARRSLKGGRASHHLMLQKRSSACNPSRGRTGHSIICCSPLIRRREIKSQPHQAPGGTPARGGGAGARGTVPASHANPPYLRAAAGNKSGAKDGGCSYQAVKSASHTCRMRRSGNFYHFKDARARFTPVLPAFYGFLPEVLFFTNRWQCCSSTRPPLRSPTHLLHFLLYFLCKHFYSVIVRFNSRIMLFCGKEAGRESRKDVFLERATESRTPVYRQRRHVTQRMPKIGPNSS